jgi:hypothetical protein
MKSTKPRKRRPHKAGKKTTGAKSAWKRARKLVKKSARPKRTPTGRAEPRRAAAAASIDDLGLIEHAKSGAQALRDKFPNIVFTSGRRGVEQQASAMAGNVVRKRKWIQQTYRASPQRDALQKWVDNHPEATTKAAISAGLKGIMDGWTDAQKARFSSHFGGLAFDVKPVSQNGAKIKSFIRSLPHLHQFLESEGGLTIWHAAFDRA